MPRPGVPNNAAGANGVDDPTTGHTSVAGLVQRNQGLISQPVPAGASAVNSPRRAQRRATHPNTTATQSGEIAAPLPAQAPPDQPTYGVQLAHTWGQVAAVPGASPLVQQYAQEAQLAGQ
jgi:hypothetical protein